MRITRKTYILLPSAFTSGNLFCGFFSVISAMRTDLMLACWLIVMAALLDFIDGKVAMFSHTDSRFGVELDSLADLVSFGIAPGIIMYQYFLKVNGEWSWLISFLFVLCGALRLARFNVETKGPDKTHFKGLPIPMAAAALISFIPFAQTTFFLQFLARFHYNRFLVFMILLLAALMVSNIEYPAMPRFKLLTVRGKIGLLIFASIWILILLNWEILLFPATFLYIIWGVGRAIILGAVTRLPDRNA
jgi:CDP-diacylglycerol---serine O-phosphatidyltransferase